MGNKEIKWEKYKLAFMTLSINFISMHGLYGFCFDGKNSRINLEGKNMTERGSIFIKLFFDFELKIQQTFHSFLLPIRIEGNVVIHFCTQKFYLSTAFLILCKINEKLLSLTSHLCVFLNYWLKIWWRHTVKINDKTITLRTALAPGKLQTGDKKPWNWRYQLEAHPG